MILISVAEGFCHAANEGMSTGCNLIMSDIPVLQELSNTAKFVALSKTTPHPDCLGNLCEVSVESLIIHLKEYVKRSHAEKKKISSTVRKEYEQRHSDWMERMERLRQYKDVPTYSLKDLLPPEDSLPCVSVVTLTRDRKMFVGLAKYSFLCQAYPADKIEWVIVDDGRIPIKSLVSDLPYVKYIPLDKHMSIGAKRNIGVEAASHDIIVHMDDDDIYPNHSVLTRVAMMGLAPSKKCVFSTTIPCYSIMEHKSFMNVPPMQLKMSQRVSEATMAYTRDFWLERKFPDTFVGEADAFLVDREEMCRELSPQDIIVSLCHPLQSTSRKAPEMEEPNGCHYGFSEELFSLVEEIRMLLEIRN
jgi:hypothetical protein